MSRKILLAIVLLAAGGGIAAMSYLTRTNCDLARDVVAGKDVLTDISWSMQHGKPEAPLKAYVDTSRCLVKLLAELDEKQKGYADSFLCQDAIGPKLKSCTVPQINQRLDLLETVLKKSRKQVGEPSDR
jgi:hypothetical protein